MCVVPFIEHRGAPGRLGETPEKAKGQNVSRKRMCVYRAIHRAPAGARAVGRNSVKGKKNRLGGGAPKFPDSVGLCRHLPSKSFAAPSPPTWWSHL
ncbi:hypothetical protein NL676_022605 [Syzygium grande]|nr:hypothetical protein NL676_022605 [Syzygium grande]